MKALGVLLFLAMAVPVFAAEEIRHPLDPLTAEEISTAVSVLHDAEKVDDSARYPHVLLSEPPKKAVLDWKPGDAIPRRAHASANPAFSLRKP